MENTQNKDKKSNETDVYQSPLRSKPGFNIESKYKNIHEMYQIRLQNHDTKMLGVRRRTPYGNLEKQFYWYTARTIFSKAE